MPIVPGSALSTGRHRRPQTCSAGRNALRIALAAALAGGGVVALADPAAALTQLLCPRAGQQVQCQTSDFSTAYQITAPDGFTSAHIVLAGGEGGHGAVEEGDDRTYLRAQAGPGGGAGGRTDTVVSLSPGQIIDIYVGGPGGNAADCTGGIPGKSGGLNNGGAGGNGYFHDSLCDGPAGGGGGGGTFVMPHGRQPGQVDPLAAAGGGGGGSGAGGGDSGGGIGGRGGGNASGPSTDGGSEGNPTGGGASGDASHDRPGVGGDGAPGVDCPPSGYRATTVNSSDCIANYGGGGGGGGRFGGHGGDQGEGGGGGSGLPSGGPADVSPASFHAAQVGGSFAITFRPPGAGSNPPLPKGGGPSSNDPNPNTNPPQPTPGDVRRTTTVLCEPRVGQCRVGPIVGPDSVFNVFASGGTSRAELFGTLQGGGRPDCPNYTELNSDWLAFGFRDPLAGSTWGKLSTLTTRHKLSKRAAIGLSRRMQICFEAPYRFVTRNGYALGGHNALFDGVLPDCAVLPGHGRGGASPCVASRQVRSRHGGWVVHFAFRVPASAQDPKALG